MDIINILSKKFPDLKRKLYMARINTEPEAFVKKNLSAAFMFSIGMTVFSFFMLSMMKKPLWLLLFVFPVLLFGFFMILMKAPNVKINKIRRDLDREVIFAGRFLLVKLNSGRPLLNALIDASNSYGVAAKYFKEIVDDIDIGTSLEDALEKAMKYSPSKRFRRIIFQISNAIKIGVDVSESLAETLDEITKEQFIEIQRYGKKLNSIAMFYMILAVIMPSLGVTILIVLGTMMGIFTQDNTIMIFGLVIAFLVIVQFIFITIFKSSRLSVNV